MKAFPKVGSGAGVDPADRISAIDFVNRVNWWFETWDVESMVDAFLPDAVAYHFHGTISGREEMRHFFDHEYPYLIPGVSRHGTNHIVDKDEDGVVVRYHNLLVRYASPESAVALQSGNVMSSPNDLPAIWISTLPASTQALLEDDMASEAIVADDPEREAAKDRNQPEAAPPGR